MAVHGSAFDKAKAERREVSAEVVASAFGQLFTL
jgi:hypothetical protein